MKIFLKLAFFISLTSLTACSVSTNTPPLQGFPENKVEKISNQPLQGMMNQSAWMMTRAVGKVQSDGLLMVSISGNGEVINCNYSTPLNPGLLFSIPMKIAEYDFDMLRPNEGYPVTWVYTDIKSHVQNSFSDMAHLSITSVTTDRMIGGLSAKFLDPSSPGFLNGVFEITICP